MKQSSEKRKEFYDLTKKLQEAKQDARDKAYKELEEKNRKRNDTIKKIELRKRDIESIDFEIKLFENDVTSYNQLLDDCFKKYNIIQETIFQYDEKQNICPLLNSHICDSPALLDYLEKNKQKAEADFNVKKQEELQKILEKGKSYKAERDERKRIIEKDEERILSIAKEIEYLETVVNSMPDYSKQAIDEASLVIPGKEEMNLKMQHINKEI